MAKWLIGAGVLVAVLAAAIGWYIYRQQAALGAPPGGSGVVEGTPVELSSHVGAHIERLPAEEGTAVHAGQLLVHLDCAEPEAALAEAEARLAAVRAEAEASGARARAAERREAAARASSDAAVAQRRALSEQEGAAKRDARRLEEMGRHATAAKVDESRSAADRLAHEVQAAAAGERSRELEATAAAEEAQAVRRSVSVLDSEARALEAAVERARIQVRECEVRAPRAAWVDAVYYEEGELAPPGAVLVRLVELDPVEVTFYLPNADLAAAEVGAPATVRADAWPDLDFRGEVVTVGAEAEFTPRNVQTRSERDRLVYPIEVHVPNPDLRLRPGMPVEVTLPPQESS